jgi:hypothetical protein
MQHDDVVWALLNNGFCSFKYALAVRSSFVAHVSLAEPR